MTDWACKIAHEVNKEGWETATFPLLCETCLGDNPYIRMQKEHASTECKICVRPFTLFRWKAGTNGRYKATIVCQSCAKMKNVCQTCLFDLEYGLPVQVRDRYLEELGHEKLEMPESRVGRDYVLQNAHAEGENDEKSVYGKVGKHPMLERLARKTPYYKRNEARLCSFFVKGACNRGGDCPFKHELPKGGELANQKLRDRFHGENDPLAAKIMRKADDELTLMPPEDKSVTTLYLGGLEPTVTEKEVRDKFYVHGEIRSIRMVKKQCCAFVTYVKREEAEVAASNLHRILELKGKRVHVMWGRPQVNKQTEASEAMAASSSGAIAGAPPVPGMPPGGMPGFPAAGASGTYKPYYPSMDPAAMGNTPLEGEGPNAAPAAAPARKNQGAAPVEAGVAQSKAAAPSSRAPKGQATGTGAFKF